MNPIIWQHFKNLRDHIMRHNCLQGCIILAEIGLKLPNCTKAGFLWKLTNVTIVYLLCLILLKCFKKNLYDRSWDIRLNNFGSNWVLIIFSPEKKIFWENWLMLLSTYPASLFYNMSKKIFTVEQIMRHKVSQFWAKLASPCPFHLKGDSIDWY